jgi:hypothetical protein
MNSGALLAVVVNSGIVFSKAGLNRFLAELSSNYYNSLCNKGLAFSIFLL